MTTEEAKDVVCRVLKTLSFRERHIILLRTGAGDGYVYTLKEVGAIFNISPERVRQIQRAAEKKLRHPVRMAALSPALEVIRRELVGEAEVNA